MLARTLDTGDQVDAANRSAVATATEAAAEAGSVRTAAELLADASQLAATERTATWLDQLTDTGAISPADRARIAAEDGAASLTRILRRAELAGHDPQQVLAEAVDGPVVRRAAEPVERDLQPHPPRLRRPARPDRRVLHRLGTPRGQPRMGHLPHRTRRGRRPARDRAGPRGRRRPPRRGPSRRSGPCPRRAANATSGSSRPARWPQCGNSAEHADDADALGPAPKPGQVEAYAAYRAAWRTLGRPEIDREELELSDGQLRVRVRAHDREATWAPRYVGNELAGTRQAATTHEQTAALRTAEADDAADPAERDRLHAEAAQARALAETLTARAEELQAVDDARARWLAHTAGTRAAAERAKAELGARHVDDTEPEQQVTAEEWLAAHHAEQRVEDPHRVITETDVDDQRDDQVDDDMPALDDADNDAPSTEQEDARAAERDRVEVPEPDVREVAAAEPAPVEEDVVRVPSADETARAIEDANRALIEMQAREAADVHAEEQHRAAELTRWHTDDQTADVEVAEMEGVDDAHADYGSYEPAGN
ncbi:MAG: hypothetical protein WKF73_18920 [Nocardioidaceae bacterium]